MQTERLLESLMASPSWVIGQIGTELDCGTEFAAASSFFGLSLEVQQGHFQHDGMWKTGYASQAIGGPRRLLHEKNGQLAMQPKFLKTPKVC